MDGFTIKGSYGGAGIYLVSSANISIMNCKIMNNRNYGIRCEDFSHPDVYNCTFIDNSSRATSFWNHCWPEISFCVFDGNEQTDSGIYMDNLSVVYVSDTSFKNHINYGIYGNTGTLTLTGSTFYGGSNGLYLYDVTTAMTDCYIKNSGTIGVYGYNSDLTIENSILDHSTGRGIKLEYGSNLYLDNSIIRYCGNNGVDLSDNLATTIKNNWIHNNTAKGISFTRQSSVPLIRNNTIYDNSTYGIWSSQQGADPNVINCIIYGNDTNDLYRESGSFNKVNYCLLQHTHSGNGNITGSPGFLNPTEPNDLHISDTSLCKNAGDPGGSYGAETDIDGEPRIAYERVDIGGDEFYWCRADYNKDGIVNFYDFALFGSAWRNQDPNITLDADSDVDIDDLRLFSNDWLWQAGWIQGQWMMSSGASGDEISAETLMLPDTQKSMLARPARLRLRTDKFYSINPDETISALRRAQQLQQAQSKQMFATIGIEESLSSEESLLSPESAEEEAGLTAEQIEENVEWLDQLWQSGDLLGWSEQEYLETRIILQEMTY